MKYVSVCSGIEAATMAWHGLGWKPLAFSEIEPFPSAVLAYHYPDVINEGDFTQIGDKYDLTDGLLAGGTPCQDFSVAGLRAGLDGKRGNLSVDFIKLAFSSNATWICWENVPGVLSSGSGQDFATILSGFTGCKINTPSEGWQNSGIIQAAEGCYSIAWRVLDAQYFGVAQRRRRVFVVGYSGGWQYPSAVLFERASLLGNPAPSRGEGKGVTCHAESSIGGYRQEDCGGTLKASGGVLSGGSETFIASKEPKLYENHPNDSRVTGPHDKCPAVVSRYGTGGGNVPLVQEGGIGQVDWRTANADNGDVAQTLKTDLAHQSGPCICIAGNVIDRKIENGRNGKGTQEEIAYTLNTIDKLAVCFEPGILKREGGDSRVSNEQCSTLRAEMGDNQPAVATTSQVRRLTPIECERLQGFPDDFTRIPWRGKEPKDCPDGPRYKALGNSMAVPCIKWLGERIEMVNNIEAEQRRNNERSE